MFKAPVYSVLALSVLAALAGCAKKEEAASATAPAAAAPPAATAPAAGMPGPMGDHPAAQPTAAVDLAGIAKADNGLTVADVFAQKDTLGGKGVTVRGKVVKVNSGIMGKDWVHVRDGSGAEGTNDLTVTTSSQPLPKVGDLVLVTGPVTLNKDFGMGYTYAVIVEGADVKIETAAP